MERNLSDGSKAIFCRLALAVVGLMLWGWAPSACGGPKPPEFPVYAPTEQFLAEQERNEKRAAEFYKTRQKARAGNLARHQQKTLSEWEPIFERIRIEQERQEEERKKREQEKEAAEQ